jgi:hypothetical protein
MYFLVTFMLLLGFVSEVMELVSSLIFKKLSMLVYGILQSFAG